MNSQKNWQENLTFRELLHEKQRHHVKENDAGQLAEIGKTAGKRKIQGKTQHVCVFFSRAQNNYKIHTLRGGPATN